MRTGPIRWHVIVPLKDLRRAKSRLGVPADHRRQLMRAFAGDVLFAATHSTGVESVTVVADRSWMSLLPDGVSLAADPGRGLNAAIRDAAGTRPDSARIAVLVGDLPCLRPAALTDLLSAAGRKLADGTPVVVADQHGRGTTMLLAICADLNPRFGEGSLRAHQDAGAVALAADRWPGARLDVDDDADLRSAARLGVGSHTRQALSSIAGDLPA